MHGQESDSAQQPTSPDGISLFNLDDPAERFMAGWVSRVHTEPPRLFKALDLKRADRQLDGQRERLIIELALWRGRPRCYLIIVWNIDEISMRWREFANRPEAVTAYNLGF